MSLIRYIYDACKDVPTIQSILEQYFQESRNARFYSMFSFLICRSLGGEETQADNFARVMEAFFLATSIHDDIMDQYDSALSKLEKNLSISNNFIISGDLLFVELAKYFALSVHGLPRQHIEQIAEKLEKHLFDIAESQIVDIIEQKGKIMSLSKVIKHIRQRGGLWGRMSFELAAMIANNTEHIEDISSFGLIGEKFYMGLTLRDDLEDIQDDMANQVYTYPICWLFENKDDPGLKTVLNEDDYIFIEQISQNPDLISKNQVRILQILDKTRAIDITAQEAQKYLQDAQKLMIQLLEKRAERSYGRWMLFQQLMRGSNTQIIQTANLLKKQILELKKEG
ncbi:MAG: polyprenyl synthetase family protein [Candidatus Hodarchaeota archaeon]